mmetsp:Transcript_8153/g.21617  ORF Transcript_8153/g.21617 Transcript_8153/m.21617 type:complete len:81 (-) Transcript_8153:1479-1721(-)
MKGKRGCNLSGKEKRKKKEKREKETKKAVRKSRHVNGSSSKESTGPPPHEASGQRNVKGGTDLVCRVLNDPGDRRPREQK